MASAAPLTGVRPIRRAGACGRGACVGGTGRGGRASSRGLRPHGQVGGILLYSGADLEVLAGGRWVHTAYLCKFSPGADETNITVAALGTAPGR